MVTSFFEQNELVNFGFKSVGRNVLISRFAQFYGCEKIEIGDNVRIDDFCILSGEIKLHNNIHIGAYCVLFGRNGIEMEDYSGLSPRCTVFSATDDFSGDYLIGPMADSRYTNVQGGKVWLKKYSQIGANCVVMPNVTIAEGAVLGAMSLVKRDLDDWSINSGIPSKFIKPRNRNLTNYL
ncbi:acyltransferase [uncultured Draconibacterium sp.]|uniref:acyltransferase n=1 Tax=uncultured Draconibacterium sp. TaxID=1573823 RepID=UPI0032170252